MPDKTYLDDIQANIIKPHGREFCTFLFFRFRSDLDVDVYRTFCNSIGMIVTSHSDQIKDTRNFKASKKDPKTSYKSEIIINAGFSGEGFDYFKTVETRQPLDGAFREGMVQGKYRLNDYGLKAVPKSQDNYNRYSEAGVRTGKSGISGFISFAADRDRRGEPSDKIKGIKRKKWFIDAVETTFEEKGHTFKNPDDERPGKKGPLGFREGLSETRSYEEAARIGLARERWHSVLEDVVVGGTPFGSYMVFRKIKVIKEKFEEMVLELSIELYKGLSRKIVRNLSDDLNEEISNTIIEELRAELDKIRSDNRIKVLSPKLYKKRFDKVIGALGEASDEPLPDKIVNRIAEEFKTTAADKDLSELAAAMFMGRFRDGSPLILTDEPTSDLDRLHTNVSTPFDYSSDRTGTRCPFHAHIRLMNDRKNGPAAAQIIRRGYNYGKDPEAPEGILFMSFQASIVNQFEPLFERMSEPGLKDPIAYSGTDSAAQRYPLNYGSTATTIPIEGGKRALTTFQGGEYFYVPSITFLNKRNW